MTYALYIELLLISFAFLTNKKFVLIVRFLAIIENIASRDYRISKKKLVKKREPLSKFKMINKNLFKMIFIEWGNS
jgi:hypothetical protein